MRPNTGFAPKHWLCAQALVYDILDECQLSRSEVFRQSSKHWFTTSLVRANCFGLVSAGKLRSPSCLGMRSPGKTRSAGLRHSSSKEEGCQRERLGARSSGFCLEPQLIPVFPGCSLVQCEQTKKPWAQEPCESRGGHPGIPSLIVPMVSVDVKQHSTTALSELWSCVKVEVAVLGSRP